MPMPSFVLGTALRDLRRTGVLGIVGILLSALAVLIAGGVAVGLDALSRLTATWQTELRVVAILREESTTTAAKDELMTTVRALPGTGPVRYVSAAEALADLRRYLGPSEAGLDRLPVNPVPARLEVTPTGRLRAAGLRALIVSLGRVPGVEDVQAAVGWVAETERLERALRLGGFGLAGVIGVLAILVIAGGTVVARQRRADETAVLRVAGVPEGRLWMPLLLQALAQGGAGAALGVSALLLASGGGVPALAAWLRTDLGLTPLPVPSWSLGAGLFGA
ncbi:MAG: cell division protein FtsX, partial [Candidatus Rokuibacteriota bacterium]